MWQNNIFLAWIDWPGAFDFRIGFGKTLSALNFDEKLTQALHKWLCNITCQKIFFPCTLRLVRCFQFQGMIRNTEVCRVGKKNLAFKIWRWKSRIWFCCAFVYFVDFITIYFASLSLLYCKWFYLYRPL